MVKISEPSAPPLYPNLQEVPQVAREDKGETFRLKKISNIREFLEKELETRGRYRRRYKSLYNTAIYVNAGACLAAVACSVATGTSALTAIGIFAAVPLGFTAVGAGVLSVISTWISKILLKKVEKHQEIKHIAASKLLMDLFQKLFKMDTLAMKNIKLFYKKWKIIVHTNPM